eukprot:TRINITY_DN2110_c3_g1_i4.p1 TRINITY_DN2110_c3_g1~~TRINITY_DN2110_c3_g1_i4.p1  ORF type:complete len:1452 (+),score=430.58 TRINITY_DN2110_c3_g1_i4:93-4358(+)
MPSSGAVRSRTAEHPPPVPAWRNTAPRAAPAQRASQRAAPPREREDANSGGGRGNPGGRDASTALSGGSGRSLPSPAPPRRTTGAAKRRTDGAEQRRASPTKSIEPIDRETVYSAHSRRSSLGDPQDARRERANSLQWLPPALAAAQQSAPQRERAASLQWAAPAEDLQRERSGSQLRALQRERSGGQREQHGAAEPGPQQRSEVSGTQSIDTIAQLELLEERLQHEKRLRALAEQRAERAEREADRIGSAARQQQQQLAERRPPREQDTAEAAGRLADLLMQAQQRLRAAERRGAAQRRKAADAAGAAAARAARAAAFARLRSLPRWARTRRRAAWALRRRLPTALARAAFHRLQLWRLTRRLARGAAEGGAAEGGAPGAAERPRGRLVAFAQGAGAGAESLQALERDCNRQELRCVVSEARLDPELAAAGAHMQRIAADGGFEPGGGTLPLSELQAVYDTAARGGLPAATTLGGELVAHPYVRNALGGGFSRTNFSTLLDELHSIGAEPLEWADFLARYYANTAPARPPARPARSVSPTRYSDRAMSDARGGSPQAQARLRRLMMRDEALEARVQLAGGAAAGEGSPPRLGHAGVPEEGSQPASSRRWGVSSPRPVSLLEKVAEAGGGQPSTPHNSWHAGRCTSAAYAPAAGHVHWDPRDPSDRPGSPGFPSVGQFDPPPHRSRRPSQPHGGSPGGLAGGAEEFSPTHEGAESAVRFPSARFDPSAVFSPASVTSPASLRQALDSSAVCDGAGGVEGENSVRVEAWRVAPEAGDLLGALPALGDGPASLAQSLAAAAAEALDPGAELGRRPLGDLLTGPLDPVACARGEAARRPLAADGAHRAGLARFLRARGAGGDAAVAQYLASPQWRWELWRGRRLSELLEADGSLPIAPSGPPLPRLAEVAPELTLAAAAAAVRHDPAARLEWAERNAWRSSSAPEAEAPPAADQHPPGKHDFFMLAVWELAQRALAEHAARAHGEPLARQLPVGGLLGGQLRELAAAASRASAVVLLSLPPKWQQAAAEESVRHAWTVGCALPGGPGGGCMVLYDAGRFEEVRLGDRTAGSPARRRSKGGTPCGGGVAARVVLSERRGGGAVELILGDIGTGGWEAEALLDQLEMLVREPACGSRVFVGSIGADLADEARCAELAAGRRRQLDAALRQARRSGCIARSTPPPACPPPPPLLRLAGVPHHQPPPHPIHVALISGAGSAEQGEHASPLLGRLVAPPARAALQLLPLRQGLPLRHTPAERASSPSGGAAAGAEWAVAPWSGGELQTGEQPVVTRWEAPPGARREPKQCKGQPRRIPRGSFTRDEDPDEDVARPASPAAVALRSLRFHVARLAEEVGRMQDRWGESCGACFSSTMVTLPCSSISLADSSGETTASSISYEAARIAQVTAYVAALELTGCETEEDLIEY